MTAVWLGVGTRSLSVIGSTAVALKGGERVPARPSNDAYESTGRHLFIFAMDDISASVARNCVASRIALLTEAVPSLGKCFFPSEQMSADRVAL